MTSTPSSLKMFPHHHSLSLFNTSTLPSPPAPQRGIFHSEYEHTGASLTLQSSLHLPLPGHSQVPKELLSTCQLLPHLSVTSQLTAIWPRPAAPWRFFPPMTSGTSESHSRRPGSLACSVSGGFGALIAPSSLSPSLCPLPGLHAFPLSLWSLPQKLSPGPLPSVCPPPSAGL